MVKKKKTKNEQALRRKKEYHSVKKRKNILGESDLHWQSSTLTPRFRTKSLQNKICHTQS